MQILDKNELHLKIGKNGLLADNSILDCALKYEEGIEGFDKILTELSNLNQIGIRITKYPKGIRLDIEFYWQYTVAIAFEEIQNIRLLTNKLVIQLNDGKSVSFFYESINRNRIIQFFNNYVVKHLLPPIKLSSKPIAEKIDEEGSLHTEARFRVHLNRIMNSTAIVLFTVMILVCYIVFSFILEDIYTVNKYNSIDYFAIENLLGLPLIAILFLIGRYFYKVPKRKDVSDFNKELLNSKLVSGIIIVITGATSPFVLWEYNVIVFILQLFVSLMFIIALTLEFRKKTDPTYLLLIIGGILTIIPFGIFAIIAGVRLKKINSLGYE